MIASLFMLSALAFAKSDTYIYDYWGEIEKSPDVYRVSHVLYADDLNLDVGLRNPQGLFCKDNFVYVIDTDNNRIIELEYTQKKQVELIRVIDSFNAPEGVINQALLKLTPCERLNVYYLQYFFENSIINTDIITIND